MANRQQIQEYEQKQKAQEALKQGLGYDYIEIEYILQESDKSKEKRQNQQEKLEGYALSAKISRKELRKDRRKRQKSWIEINHPIREDSVSESRISY